MCQVFSIANYSITSKELGNQYAQMCIFESKGLIIREYDQWWERTGRYAQGEEADKKWFDDVKSLQAFVGTHCKYAIIYQYSLKNIYYSDKDTVLEFASGTGIWTKVCNTFNYIRFNILQYLIENTNVKSVHCIDGNEEVLKILLSKYEEKRSNITCTVADIFTWNPPSNEVSLKLYSEKSANIRLFSRQQCLWGFSSAMYHHPKQVIFFQQ